MGKKGASPQAAFFSNSTLGDMSNVWSKYRRNLNEQILKSGQDTPVGARNAAGKAHSLSRQEYLV